MFGWVLNTPLYSVGHLYIVVSLSTRKLKAISNWCSVKSHTNLKKPAKKIHIYRIQACNPLVWSLKSNVSRFNLVDLNSFINREFQRKTPRSEFMDLNLLNKLTAFFFRNIFFHTNFLWGNQPYRIFQLPVVTRNWNLLQGYPLTNKTDWLQHQPSHVTFSKNILWFFSFTPIVW